jgi:hypothetical protein
VKAAVSTFPRPQGRPAASSSQVAGGAIPPMPTRYARLPLLPPPHTTLTMLATETEAFLLLERRHLESIALQIFLRVRLGGANAGDAKKLVDDGVAAFRKANGGATLSVRTWEECLKELITLMIGSMKPPPSHAGALAALMITSQRRNLPSQDQLLQDLEVIKLFRARSDEQRMAAWYIVCEGLPAHVAANKLIARRPDLRPEDAQAIIESIFRGRIP